MQCKEFTNCTAVSFNGTLMPGYNAITDLMRVGASVALVEAAKRPHIVCPTPVVLDSHDDRYSACSQSDIVGAPSGTHNCSPAWNAWECADV